MPGLYNIVTRSDGEVLSASKYNSDHQNHIDNQTPQATDDYSSNVSQMQTVISPGDVGSESLATTLAGELERLRYAIKQIKGTAQWYSAFTPPPAPTFAGVPGISLNAVTGEQTIASLTITAANKPICIVNTLALWNTAVGTGSVTVRWKRGGSTISTGIFVVGHSSLSGNAVPIPVGTMFDSTPGTGAVTYTITAEASTGNISTGSAGSGTGHIAAFELRP